MSLAPLVNTQSLQLSQSMLWPSLAAARFVLAVIVAGGHLAYFVPRTDRVCNEFLKFSPFTAVIGFFIISGYSIAASYEKEPSGYYYRRVVRIMPLYILAVLWGAICLIPFNGHLEPAGFGYNAPSIFVTIANLFFLQGIVCGPVEANGVIWTLAIEVALYVVAPLLARLSTAALILIMLSSAALFLATNHYGTPYFDHHRNGSAIPLLAWPWLLGFIAFRLKDRVAAGLLTLAAAVIILSYMTGSLGNRHFVTITIVALALGFGGQFQGSKRLARFLGLLGDISYPLYLIHYPLYLVLYGYKFKFNSVILLIGACMLAFMLDRFYDMPIKAALTGRLKWKGSPA